MNTLTDRQQQVLEFIRRTLQQNGIAPTLREIADHFRFRSVKAAADHVQVLRRKGWVTTQPRRARTLQVTSRAPQFPIPLYGSIPAGLPDDRRQESRGGMPLDLASLGIRPTARTFVLEVLGDSMIGRHILPGDLVVLEHGKTPRSGDVVAALIDNESTLKTFVQERGAPPCLRAENPRYPQLHPAAELVIQGVMVGLVRRCRP
ncbi:MAG TPA: transcriptional repressor LexA [Verrucomicrobiota bacterium]|nr:transcriptional repressor LexA [Verrucomicrobiota bacterium]HNU52689.1 transcriptional repressor LexA [Verrucomicrobiota bacterium]